MNWLSGMGHDAPPFNWRVLTSWLTPDELEVLSFDYSVDEPVTSRVLVDFNVGERNSKRVARDIPDCPSATRDWFNVGEPCDCYACWTRASPAMVMGTSMIVTYDEHFWLDDDDPRCDATGLAELISEGGECRCPYCTYYVPGV